MTDAQETLRETVRDYLASGDTAWLRTTIAAHPEIVSEEHGAYPDLHRILDLVVDGRHLRLCRWISRGERLSLVPMTPPRLAEPAIDGVPLWLSGPRLREWADDEEEALSQAATDGERYR